MFRPMAITVCTALFAGYEQVMTSAGKRPQGYLLPKDWHVTGQPGRDQRVETARLASDFEWTWARFAGDHAQIPEELVVIGGQMLELEGKEILKSARRINYLVASRVGDQFRLETDDGVLDLALPIHDLESVFSNRQSQI